MTKPDHTPNFDDTDLAQVIEAGRRRRATRLHAVSASYLAPEDMVEIALDRGIILKYPRAAIAEFASVPPAQMQALTLSPRGSALELDATDAHVDVHGLLTSLLPPADLAKGLAQHGRKTTSANQAQAARKNGQRGGRPRKGTTVSVAA